MLSAGDSVLKSGRGIIDFKFTNRPAGQGARTPVTPRRARRVVADNDPTLWYNQV
jgi:hypothetical protein